VKTVLISLATVLAFVPLVLADGHVFKSAVTQTHLVELFSSEGCSSCPPADRWLSSLRQNPELWKSFVPLEFHVDYWNRLGWIDKNSKSAFTDRQRAYAKSWKRDSVYTPGFVLDGREWTRVEENLRQPGAQVGELSATLIAGDRYKITFHPTQPHDRITVHAAVLGNGLVTHVEAGENQGSTLKHDFVVLALVEKEMTKEKDKSFFTAQIEIKPSVRGVASRQSVAFWVTEATENQPIQAVGGDLSQFPPE
jgi:hypothetical protein